MLPVLDGDQHAGSYQLQRSHRGLLDVLLCQPAASGIIATWQALPRIRQDLNVEQRVWQLAVRPAMLISVQN